MTGTIFYYKLQSPYPNDVTKNCKLSINEIDNNFLTLKDADIDTAEFVRENKTLVLTRNDGEKLIVPLTDVTYNLDVNSECTPSGVTLTFTYDSSDGWKTVRIANVMTADTVKELVKREGKVITDGTLEGEGNIDSPLGMKKIERTGMYAPVLSIIDLTRGGKLPSVAKLGDRYITNEYVNDYGYLYNGAALNKISSSLDIDCRGWRIPSKADWDKLLNSIEPCGYRNHNSAKCHVELGKFAGKYLKSDCGWLGQQDCECAMTKPITGCTTVTDVDDYLDCNEYNGMVGQTTTNGVCNEYNDLFGNSQVSNGGDEPDEKCESPIGVDRYGLGILPSGCAVLDAFGRPQSSAFKEKGLFWTSSHVNGDIDQDVYVKDFEWNKGGVYQVAECPSPYYSLRLVKDYDGSNYFGLEHINGVLYKTILFPESRQIWLASNYSCRDGLIGTGQRPQIPEYVEVNNGEIIERRKEFFINEWNGNYWETKMLKEGDTVVVENPCFGQGTGTTTEISWIDSSGITHTIEIEIPTVSQHNIEYRVYTDNTSCDKVLINSDDLVVERVLNILIPMLESEREERIVADNEINARIDDVISAMTEISEALNERIDEEISARTEADEALNERIDEEISARTEADEALNERIDEEISARTEADEALNERIDEEISARTEADEALNERIDEEISARTEADEALNAKIDEEIARATNRENEIEVALNEEISRATQKENEIEGQLIDSTQEYTIHASSGLELLLKNGNVLKIGFDGNYGQV